ncbi:type IV pilin N-terminal domain-containing protein [Methanocorpusculum sp.]|nr:type IV pilin N-terminal domain-containing protein [Methanocorpusculum sp.]MBP3444268.1 type IV pilin N-terminal domain-containing protein [Methanocorpusculaceae archaeon]
MIQKKSDDAISPVIGVMLMLVITVVIAATVTIFATGVVGETEAAPVSVLDVKIFSNTVGLTGLYGPDFWITHVSGDAVNTKDIELRLSWTHKDDAGKDCSHYSIHSAAGMSEKYPDGITVNYVPREQALYMKSTKEGAASTGLGLDHYFGSAILTPGEKLFASSDMLPMDYCGTCDPVVNTGSEFMDLIFDNYQITAESGSSGCEMYGWAGTPTTGGIMDHLQPGTAVDVMIVHLPSNKAIYDKTVMVQ